MGASLLIWHRRAGHSPGVEQIGDRGAEGVSVIGKNKKLT